MAKTISTGTLDLMGSIEALEVKRDMLGVIEQLQELKEHLEEGLDCSIKEDAFYTVEGRSLESLNEFFYITFSAFKSLRDMVNEEQISPMSFECMIKLVEFDLAFCNGIIKGIDDVMSGDDSITIVRRDD